MLFWMKSNNESIVGDRKTGPRKNGKKRELSESESRKGVRGDGRTIPHGLKQWSEMNGRYDLCVTPINAH